MIIRLRSFAMAKDLIGQELVELEVPEGATVGDVRSLVAAKFPQIAEVIGHLMIAVNAEYAGDSTVITAGSEVACIPPVSGG